MYINSVCRPVTESSLYQSLFGEFSLVSVYDSAVNYGDTAGKYEYHKASLGQLVMSGSNFGLQVVSLAFMCAMPEGIADGGCFVAGTSVQTATVSASTKGLVRKPTNIEQVRVGDLVASRDEKTGKLVYKKVVNLSVRKVPLIAKVTLVTGKNGKVAEVLTTTRNHPFYVQGKGFVPAGGLAVGNAIITRAGPPLYVKSIQWERRAEGYPVYNFEVEGTHTYFVGKTNGGVWVHNPRYCPAQLTMEQDLGLPVVTEGYQWHHPFPKYLGGAEDQPLVLIPESYHNAIHTSLDTIYPRYLGTNTFRNVPLADKRRALSRVYNQFPLTDDPYTGLPFQWK